MSKVKCELFNDHFQNYKRYSIPKAQLVIADIPYNLGNNAYASNPLAKEEMLNTDEIVLQTDIFDFIEGV